MLDLISSIIIISHAMTMDWLTFSVAVLTIANVECKVPECLEPKGFCACQTDQGLIDLSPLDSQDPNNPKFSNIAGEDSYKYSYNPCTAFSIDYGCSDVAVCQVDQYSNAYACGDQSSAAWSSSSENLVISYSSSGFGTSRTSNIKLQCDKGDEGTLTFEQESSTAVYDFTLKSKYCCPSGGGSGGLSAGSVMCIVFVVILSTYLIGGITYNKFGKGADGKELIPNAEFWMDSPSLVKDGCCFVFNSCTRKGYSEM